MLFTVELRYQRGQREWRLLEDGSWRPLGAEQSLAQGDFTTDSAAQVTYLSPRGGTIELDGELFDVDPDRSPTEHPHVHYESRVFRKSAPPMPSKSDLERTIALGDDSVNNSLILDVTGCFKLRPFEDFDIAANDPTVVVRNETFCAGNEYVGVAASEHARFIDQTFLGLIHYWLMHLETGRTGFYCDYPPSQSAEEIADAINSIRENWVAQY